jgi:plasmid maintenance system antidote protein VapI
MSRSTDPKTPAGQLLKNYFEQQKGTLTKRLGVPEREIQIVMPGEKVVTCKHCKHLAEDHVASGSRRVCGRCRCGAFVPLETE